MKFSIFYEMQISEPDPAKEQRCFRDCVDQVVLADQLGYHCVWEVEHHGLYEYSHSSAPEIFLAYVAAKTKRIRLGHGVTLTPGRYNHPLRIAERIATLDILSEGRVSWGSGKSSSLVEQRAFETEPSELHEQWREALEIIPRMWTQDVFEWRGRFFKIPPTQVIPKPVQRPHPPIYAACSKPESAIKLGELGIGALNFALGDGGNLGAKVRDYKAAAEKARPSAYTKNIAFACTPPTLVLNDDRKACRYGFRGEQFFRESMARYYFGGDRPIGLLNVPREFFSDEELSAAMAFRSDIAAPLANVIGDPVHAREAVSRFRDAGVDELILVMQMGTVPHELIMESIKTFAEHVMPHFATA